MITDKLDQFTDGLDQLENTAVDIVAKVAPWTAPLPTAYLVGRATIEHLRWPWPVGVIAAVVVECLGLATTATALTLWDYNQSKRKTDPQAPFTLALFLVGVYFVTALGLTVALDIAPDLSVYAPGVFPFLSLVGVTVLALRSDHRRRLAAIESVKMKRRAQRQSRRQRGRQGNGEQSSNRVSNNGKSNVNLDALQAGRTSKRDARIEALLTFLASNPGAGPTEAGRAIGVSRQTVYTYAGELEAAGRLRKNGSGWEAM